MLSRWWGFFFDFRRTLSPNHALIAERWRRGRSALVLGTLVSLRNLC
jgi:hypothetical protein